MGNQTSNGETSERLREKYDDIMKAHHFAEVLINSDKAYRQLWRNKMFIPEYEFATLMNIQIEASMVDKSKGPKFMLEVFNALIKYAPFEFTSMDQLVDIDLTTPRVSADSAREYAYVRAYNASQDPEEREFWDDIYSTLDDQKVMEKMTEWDIDWRTKVCN